MTGNIFALASKICNELVYNKKTQFNEGQLGNHTGSFHKKPKHYPHEKPAPSKCATPISSGMGSFADKTALRKRNPTCPHNCLFLTILALALNSSRNFLMARSHWQIIVRIFLQRCCKLSTKSQWRKICKCDEN